MLSLERGLGANTVLSVNYVGTQGHRLLVLEEANPGNPSLCLLLSNPANLAPGANSLRSFWRRQQYVLLTSLREQVYNGTRGPLGSNFGSNANQATIGNSNYNALQVTLRHSSKRLNVLAGYTYSKSAGPIFEPRRRGQSSRSGAQQSSVRIRCEAQLCRELQLSNPVRTPVPRLEPLDPGLGTLRDHAFQHRPARDSGQLWRQFAAGIRAEWHQQLWRG